MKEIIFATSNEHKVLEVQQLVPSAIITIKSLADIRYTEEIEETGDTMHENALLKAKTIFDQYQTPVFAEDSGLEVVALDNAPGIYTARYAGPNRDHNANMDLVLKNLETYSDRSAQFRAVVAYVDHSEIQYFEGIVKGRIAFSKIGTNGFGYDPIFIPEGYDTTFAVLDEHIKHSMSHRSKAINALMQFLNTKKS